MNAYDSLFARRLAEEVESLIKKRGEALAKGSAVAFGDAATTGMNYAKHVGAVDAYQIVLELIEEVSDELSGREKKRA